MKLATCIPVILSLLAAPAAAQSKSKLKKEPHISRMFSRNLLINHFLRDHAVTRLGLLAP